MFWLRRKGLPQWLAMMVVVAAIMGIGLGMAAVVGNSINRFTVELPAYQDTSAGPDNERPSAWLGQSKAFA